MADRLIAADGTEHGIIELTKAMGTRSLSRFYGFLDPDEVEEIVNCAAEGINVPARFRPILTANFDADDLAEFLSFYQTPSGEKMSRIRAALMEAVISSVSLLGRDVSMRCVEEAMRRVVEKHGIPDH
jgi:hypothetical protein